MKDGEVELDEAHSNYILFKRSTGLFKRMDDMME